MKRLVIYVMLLMVMHGTFVSAQAPFLRITPSPSTHTAAPGDTVTAPLQITNPNNTFLTVAVTAQDFIPNERPNDAPQLLNTPNSTYGISNWFIEANIKKTLTIPANQTINYDAVFRVPYGTAERTYYGAVVLTDINNQAVSFSAPMYISVGEPVPNIVITSLDFGESDDVTKRYGVFTAALQNTGSGLANVLATLNITDSSGRIVTSLQPDEVTTILPEATQIITFTPTTELPRDQPSATLLAVDQTGKTNDRTMQLDYASPDQQLSSMQQSASGTPFPWVLLLLCIAFIGLCVSLLAYAKHRDNTSSKKRRKI